jgi:hypothetical protein
METLIFLALLVAYVFVRDFKWRAAISGVLTLATLFTFLAVGGVFNLVILLLWGYLFYRDLQFAGYLRR